MIGTGMRAQESAASMGALSLVLAVDSCAPAHPARASLDEAGAGTPLDDLSRRVAVQHQIASRLDSYPARTGIFAETPFEHCLDLAAELLGELEHRMREAAR